MWVCIQFSTRALSDLEITSVTSLNRFLLCLCCYFPVSSSEWVCDGMYSTYRHLMDTVVKNSTGGQSCTREKARTGELEYDTY